MGSGQGKGGDSKDEVDWRRCQAETFIQDTPDAKHYLGSHWEPFYDDITHVMTALPGRLDTAPQMPSFSETASRQLPFPPPSDWPTATYYGLPGQRLGMASAVKKSGNNSRIQSLYPFAGIGSEHLVTIEHVQVWDGGTEAEITFFDTLFAINRGWYLKGNPYRFSLTGIAYSARTAKNEPIEMALSPDGPKMVETEGMGLLIPANGADEHDYQFHGTVKSVEELKMLDQPGWNVRATVLRALDDNAEFDLDIVVTKRAWGAEKPPQAGEDIEGMLWLQGHLAATAEWPEKP